MGYDGTSIGVGSMMNQFKYNVNDVVKTGYHDPIRSKNPIYHKVVAQYWDQYSKENYYELHYVSYIINGKPFNEEYVKETILASETEMQKFNVVGKV